MANKVPSVVVVAVDVVVVSVVIVVVDVVVVDVVVVDVVVVLAKVSSGPIKTLSPEFGFCYNAWLYYLQGVNN